WYAPQWIANPLYFVGYVAAVMLLERLIGFCVFRTELRKLHQLPQALPTQSFYESFAARHSPAMLRLGVWACVAFVAAGLVGMAMGQPNVIVAGLSAAFFAVCGWMWHYALKLKLAQPGLSVSGK
ncbi:MAG TPA: hypothetical protein VGE52_07590, partial [Pirellulales bacterium]